MVLKVYAYRVSQPSRAVIIFCKLNGIEFEEVKIDLTKGQQLTPEFRDINPIGKVPAVVDGRFKLFESHAILIYLASVFPGVSDHWDNHGYSVSLPECFLLVYCILLTSLNEQKFTRFWIGITQIYVVVQLYMYSIAPAFGRPLNPEVAAEAEKLLSASLEKLESIWLKGSGRFLVGNSQPSIADLSLVCEIMQLELVNEKDRERIMGPHKRVLQWIGDTRNAMAPHFDEVHSVLFEVKLKLKKLQAEGVAVQTAESRHSKM